MVSGLWDAAQRGEWLVPGTGTGNQPGIAGDGAGDGAEDGDGDGDGDAGDRAGDGAEDGDGNAGDGDGDVRDGAGDGNGDAGDRDGDGDGDRPQSSWTRLDPPPKRGDPACNLAAAHLLEKLRWTTLGPPYDWTKREYRMEAPAQAQVVPQDLRSLCRRLAAAAGYPDFAAQAGLVNYYREGNTLAGHVVGP
jgi:hypothetical protein